MERRPELLSSVMLRQNPHNVHEWHKRIKLFDEQPRKQIQAFTEAVRTVDPNKVPCFAGPFICLAKFSTPACLLCIGAGQAAHAVDSIC